MKLGVTGHQRLKDSQTWAWVHEQLDEFLASISFPITGFSSLAAGTDQLFAELVLAHGGMLTAVVPFDDYERVFVEESQRMNYRQLLGRATSTIVLPHLGSDEMSYYAAGRLIVDKSDILVAVWDGAPAKGLGGTGDIVSYAKTIGKMIKHINPTDRLVSVFNPIS